MTVRMHATQRARLLGIARGMKMTMNQYCLLLLTGEATNHKEAEDGDSALHGS